MDNLSEVMRGHVMDMDHMLARRRADEHHGVGPLARLDKILKETEEAHAKAKAVNAAVKAKWIAEHSGPESTVVITELTDEQVDAIIAEEAARNSPPVLPLEHHPQPEPTSGTGPENAEQQRAAEALLSLEAAPQGATSAETAPGEEERVLTIAVAPLEDVPQTTAERERESTDEFVDAQTGSQAEVSSTSEPLARETPD